MKKVKIKKLRENKKKNNERGKQLAQKNDTE